MLDELTIYNLAIKHPNTVDLVREVERMTIDEFLKRVEDEGDCGDWIEINRYYLEKIAEQIKGETE